MISENIFCNVPWFECHIYWDGSLGICCEESHKLYDAAESQYNIKDISIKDWYNSQPVIDFRQNILDNKPLSACRACYEKEKFHGSSRRTRNLSKSVIFQKAFHDSFTQSPHFKFFKQDGLTDLLPVDLHIDLGNFCNLACKMCSAKASSTIASQEIKWGIESSRNLLGQDWTKNDKVWQKFLKEILSFPNLKNIHFMGGETILTPRFEQFVDFLVDHKRFDLSISFVTNGTSYKPDLIRKMTNFKRVGIEISIETLDQRNDYIRQGSKLDIIIENIKKYQSICNNNSITVTLRPTVSALSIGNYISLLEFALTNKCLIKSNWCLNPSFLNPNVLPQHVKKLYHKKYKVFFENFGNLNFAKDFNESDPNNYLNCVYKEVLSIMQALDYKNPINVDIELEKLVQHCVKWDKIYDLNAKELYPELSEVWTKYGY